MRSRKEAVGYARRLFNRGLSVPRSDHIDPVPEKRAWHWGQCEIAALMDFIYEGKPAGADEEIWHKRNLGNR